MKKLKEWRGTLILCGYLAIIVLGGVFFVFGTIRLAASGTILIGSDTGQQAIPIQVGRGGNPTPPTYLMPVAVVVGMLLCANALVLLAIMLKERLRERFSKARREEAARIHALQRDLEQAERILKQEAPPYLIHFARYLSTQQDLLRREAEMRAKGTSIRRIAREMSINWIVGLFYYILGLLTPSLIALASSILRGH